MPGTISRPSGNSSEHPREVSWLPLEAEVTELPEKLVWVPEKQESRLTHWSLPWGSVHKSGGTEGSRAGWGEAKRRGGGCTDMGVMAPLPLSPSGVLTQLLALC